MDGGWQRELASRFHNLHKAQVHPFENFTRSYAEVLRDLNMATAELRVRSTDLAAAHSDIAALQEDIGKLSGALTAGGIAAKSLRERELEDENAALQQEIRRSLSHVSQLVAAEQRIQKLSAEGSSLKEATGRAEEKVRQLAATLVEHDRQAEEKLQRELDAAATEASERERMITEAAGRQIAHLAASEKTNEVLRKELAAWRKENEVQRESLLRAQEKLADLTRTELELTSTKQKVSELEDCVQGLQSRIQELESSSGSQTRTRASSVNQSREGNNPQDLTKAWSGASFFSCPSSLSFSGGYASGICPSYIAHVTENAHTDGRTSFDIAAVVMSDAGRYIWTGGSDGLVKCWESTNGQPVKQLSCSRACVQCMDAGIHHGSDILVAGCVDSTCHVFNLRTMLPGCQFTGHTGKVNSCALSVDASRLFTVSADRTIKAWDVARGAAIQNIASNISNGYDASFANDKLCTGHHDASLRFWDTRSGKGCGCIKNAHDREITSVRFVPSGTRVASLSRDATLRVFDTRMFKELLLLTDDRLTVFSGIVKIALSPAGDMCACGTGSGPLLVWPLSEGAAATVLSQRGHSGSVPCVCWSPDGRGVASVGVDKKLIFWR